MKVLLFSSMLLLASTVACTNHRPSAELPPPLSSLDRSLTSKANTIVLGKFETGRTPCEFLPDGTREWYLTTGFRIEETLLGSVEPSYIEVHLTSFNHEPELTLISGLNYFLLLDVDLPLSSRLTKSEDLYFWEAIGDKEVVAITSKNGEVLYERKENK